MQTGTDGSSGLDADLFARARRSAIDGPLGSFTFPAHPRERRFVFIAGGTGIAPLRSMLWHTLLAERDGHVALIYSVRSPEEFAYHAGISAARRRRANRVPSHGDARGDGRLDAAGRVASTCDAWMD